MRTMTFRSIFTTLCVLLLANIVVNLFIASKEPSIKDYNIQAEYPMDSEMQLEHDGNCVCDGLDPYCNEMPSYDETVKMLKDFQLDVQYNGDIIIYALEGNSQIYVGVHKYGSKCQLLETIEKHMIDND